MHVVSLQSLFDQPKTRSSFLAHSSDYVNVLLDCDVIPGLPGDGLQNTISARNEKKGQCISATNKNNDSSRLLKQNPCLECMLDICELKRISDPRSISASYPMTSMHK